jgi:hypothetical protein
VGADQPRNWKWRLRASQDLDWATKCVAGRQKLDMLESVERSFSRCVGRGGGANLDSKALMMKAHQHIITMLMWYAGSTDRTATPFGLSIAASAALVGDVEAFYGRIDHFGKLNCSRPPRGIGASTCTSIVACEIYPRYHVG